MTNGGEWTKPNYQLKNPSYKDSAIADFGNAKLSDFRFDRVCRRFSRSTVALDCE